jgi:hypothetical protein
MIENMNFLNAGQIDRHIFIQMAHGDLENVGADSQGPSQTMSGIRPKILWSLIFQSRENLVFRTTLLYPNKRSFIRKEECEDVFFSKREGNSRRDLNARHFLMPL